jgi:hypothetical protein
MDEKADGFVDDEPIGGFGDEGGGGARRVGE